jgi:hypothetical protein
VVVTKELVTIATLDSQLASIDFQQGFLKLDVQGYERWGPRRGHRVDRSHLSDPVRAVSRTALRQAGRLCRAPRWTTRSRLRSRPPRARVPRPFEWRRPPARSSLPETLTR